MQTINNAGVLDDPRYAFLKTVPHLGDHIFYLTLGGSRAYGTNLPDSDVDLRGGFIEQPRAMFALEKPHEEFVDTETDTCLYSLRRLVRLLTACNPNVVELLGTREEDVLFASPVGRLLRANTGLFLSKRAYITFSGYATQQLRRLQNALARDVYTQPEKERHILRSVSMDILNSGEPFNAYMLDPKQANLNEAQFNVELSVQPSAGDEYEQEIFIDGVMRHVPLREYINLNSKLSNTVRNYGKLTKRNRKKDDVHLRKHAMHLVRLYFMCLDILRDGVVVTYREREHDLLMSIRTGEVPFERVFELREQLERELEAARTASKLPEQADMKGVNDLLMRIYGDVYGLDLGKEEDK